MELCSHQLAIVYLTHTFYGTATLPLAISAPAWTLNSFSIIFMPTPLLSRQSLPFTATLHLSRALTLFFIQTIPTTCWSTAQYNRSPLQSPRRLFNLQPLSWPHCYPTNLLFSVFHLILPSHFTFNRRHFLYNYPSHQSKLLKIKYRLRPCHFGRTFWYWPASEIHSSLFFRCIFNHI